MEITTDITVLTFLIVCPLAFLAAFVDAVAGGGGLIALPAYMAAGVPPHYALGCNKLSSCMGTVVSTARYVKNGEADLKIAPGSVVLALIGSAAGANLALYVSGEFLTKLLLFVLPVAAFLVLEKDSLREKGEGRVVARRKQVAIVMASSLLIGGYDGFYGQGTGTFLLLIFTGLAGMDVRTASSNMKLVNLASNAAALATFILKGKIFWSLALTAGLFSMAGHYLGSGMVLKNGAKAVKPVMIVVFVLLFLKIAVGQA